jgi:hypothetical protein
MPKTNKICFTKLSAIPLSHKWIDYNDGDLLIGQINIETLERKVMLEMFKCCIVDDYSMKLAKILQN